MSASSPNDHPALADIRQWVDGVVVQHQFCPFAKPALASGWVAYSILDAADVESCLQQFANRVAALLEQSEPDTTELLVMTGCGASFDEFLDIAGLSEDLLEAMGWQDRVQLATFHPEYCFADTDADSAENFTNRAPWPVMQLLQVDSVGRAIEHAGDTHNIPDRNIAYLQSAPAGALQQIQQDSLKKPTH